MRAKLTARLATPGVGRNGWSGLSIPTRLALIFFVLVALMAICAPLIAQHSPLASGPAVQPPSGEHWFGTDRQGRDIFARVAYGARYSLVIGLAATAVALAVATVLGSITATANRWVAEGVMRLLDIVMSFPGIALAAVFVSVFGRSTLVLVLTIAFLYTPQLTRVVRANVLDQYGEDYVAAGRVMGASTPRLISKHVARNCAAPVLVFATVLVADAIVFEASLSFIQAGVPDPEPSWGNVIAAGRNLVMSGYWWATFFPGVAIMTTVLALNILSEGLTDAMVAPKQRQPQAPASEVAGPRKTLVKSAAVSLPDRLAELRKKESARTDRLVSDPTKKPLLVVEDLSISFPRHGDVAVVDRVSFTVRPGETLALVGESGCGKSITSLAIMGLLDPRATITGRVLFDGQDLLAMPAKQRTALLGHDIAMVYQDALSSLNPAMKIRAQMKQLTRRGGTRSAEDLLELVGLDPARTLASYPHELSGGQRQRVLIAMALTRDPQLIVADEPTTALDVTVQAQVIELLNRLREELGFAMVFVSHDLALVAELAHSVTVMYAGQVVEQGPIRDVLMQPMHEYTQGLLGSVLSIESGSDRLHQIPGSVPSPRDFPPGDRFAPRASSPQLWAGRDAVRTRVGDSEHYYAGHPTGAAK